MIALKFSQKKNSNDLYMKRMNDNIAIGYNIINGSSKINASSEEILASAIATSAFNILRFHANINEFDVDTVEATIRFITDENNVVEEIDIDIVLTGSINQNQKDVLNNILKHGWSYYYLMATKINTSIAIVNKPHWKKVISKIFYHLN